MNEKTLVIFKPDVLARGLAGEILSRFEKVGLKIVAMKMVMADENIAKEHYRKDDEWLLKKGKQMMQTLNISDGDPKKYGQMICDSLSSDLRIYPIIALILEGHKAISAVKKLVGPTNPEEAMPGTIRGDFSHDSYLLANINKRPAINLVHCTDDSKEVDREIKLWFSPEEIVSWRKPDEIINYRRGK
ncbi:TPA: nucleoside-diphosphate kinase [Candidatus Woesearchaeota archaeon]|nr:nucleoside-diphosphate kinase [Candidatus Woesearchaeota archaeon]HIH39716.1 nucleoside-diphosphate kinase [Candidatus Woesearchaeota archaeon]